MDFILSVGKIACLLLVEFSIFVPVYSNGIDCNSSCGNIQNITYPFRFKSDPQDCGDPQYQLICERNQTILQLNRKKYFVEDISYQNNTIRIVDPDLLADNCSYVPHDFITDYNLDGSQYDPYFALDHNSVVFVNCSAPVNESYYVASPPCKNGSSHMNAEYNYLLVGWFSVGDLHEDCNVVGEASIQYTGLTNPTYSTIRDILKDGVVLHFGDYAFNSRSSCPMPFDSSHCFLEFLLSVANGMLSVLSSSIHVFGYYLLGRTAVGYLCFSLFLIYKLRRRHLAMDEKIEEFLCEYKNHIPTRYSYWELLKMTARFKEKLGQGGFGSVYKGKLANGTLVAIKMLGKSTANGQEFINEVATIGRIHHVHVVQLIGFCAEGSKRALVYEFMPNGSLDKYLSSQDGKNNELEWEKLQEIALGVAKGIEYLHRGCSMKILHFDIKPHNILLDDNFTPKVSDFGLAKFYPLEDSIVSITAARGTIGYIAPELFYKKFGNISYKSDVYSYGMLLMEMAGKRKQVDKHANGSSQFYFPSWIYDQIILGDMGMGDASDDEKGIAKKLVIVALWCIQMNPVDRPSMSKVIEMLEGNLEDLDMPQRPFLSSPNWRDEHKIELEALESLNESSSDSILSAR
ncbi:rust resistance kinase Lr10-like isoform X1 [Typha latifolia]|uniref:rust resistance kinase Lr10-like isoform X1 n=2 Tax=Typha latifolia TaxID=4733 RepID=UPI003C2F5DEE